MNSIRILRWGARVSSVFLRDAKKVSVRRITNVQPSAFLHTNPQLGDTTNEENKKQELGKLEGKLKLAFTCNKCKTRNNKLVSKLAYQKGVIIVKCDGCQNNHLIADNLGWFTDAHHGTNIEKIMAQKGEKVRKIVNDQDGYFEALVEEEFRIQQETAPAVEDRQEMQNIENISSENMDITKSKIK